MKFKTYIKNRAVFESGWHLAKTGFQDQVFIDVMMKGIYNQELFFKLYAYDRKINLTNIVSSINKNKVYSCHLGTGSRMIILNRNWSMFERFPEQYETVLKQLTHPPSAGGEK